MNSPLYLDTSALAKLFLHESEGPALKAYLGEIDLTLVSSELAEVELVRAVARIDVDLIARARRLLAGMVLLPITTSVRTQAGELFPGRARSLDAIHLATALEIRGDLSGMLTYDKRMAVMAEESGIETVRPA